MVKIINFPNSPKSEAQIQAEALEMKKNFNRNISNYSNAIQYLGALRTYN